MSEDTSSGGDASQRSPAATPEPLGANASEHSGRGAYPLSNCEPPKLLSANASEPLVPGASPLSSHETPKPLSANASEPLVPGASPLSSPETPKPLSANASEPLSRGADPQSSHEVTDPLSANASERTNPTNREIEALRPARHHVDAGRPYHFLHEREAGPAGIETVNTLFLTGKECAFKCLMCDLWKNTLETPTPPGAIVRQIDYALARLPAADSIKLYNSSNFFDPKAVPVADYPAILSRVQGYRRVIVENHPKLVGDACLRFRDGLHDGRPGGPGTTLEIAMGLETIHPVALPTMNKQLTPEDFRRAARFLTSHGIRVRAFVLLNPPFITDPHEGIRWAMETVRFAFECGVHCCSIIATRPGNGIMEALQAAGDYMPPTLDALEQVFAEALRLAHALNDRTIAAPSGGKASAHPSGYHTTTARSGDNTAANPARDNLAADPDSGNRRLVFVDTWDIGFLSTCPRCFEARKNRLAAMNLDQTFDQPITCSCHS